jgi:serine O-acetyltransferase
MGKPGQQDTREPDGLFTLLRSDFGRFTETFRLRGQRYSSAKVLLESCLFKAGFQAVVLYRVSHWLYRKGFTYLAWFLTRLSVALTGAEIEFNAVIGPGMFIAHAVGLVIGRGTRIGCRVTLFQGVTFGVRNWHPDQIRSFPRVGDDCFFFAHATVVGGIAIGDQCVVGANSVVSRDVPGGALAVGVPAVIHPGKGREAIRSWGLPCETASAQLSPLTVGSETGQTNAARRAG